MSALSILVVKKVFAKILLPYYLPALLGFRSQKCISNLKLKAK